MYASAAAVPMTVLRIVTGIEIDSVFLNARRTLPEVSAASYHPSVNW